MDVDQSCNYEGGDVVSSRASATENLFQTKQGFLPYGQVDDSMDFILPVVDKSWINLCSYIVCSFMLELCLQQKANSKWQLQRYVNDCKKRGCCGQPGCLRNCLHSSCISASGSPSKCPPASPCLDCITLDLSFYQICSFFIAVGLGPFGLPWVAPLETMPLNYYKHLMHSNPVWLPWDSSAASLPKAFLWFTSIYSFSYMPSASTLPGEQMGPMLAPTYMEFRGQGGENFTSAH